MPTGCESRTRKAYSPSRSTLTWIMMQNPPHHSPNSSRIEDAVMHFITRYDQDTVLTRTKLVKLLYLADKKHFLTHDRTITGIRYFKYSYGPFSNCILDAVDGLEETGQIHIETHMTDNGRQYHHEPCCQHSHTDSSSSLTDTHFETLDAIHDEYASLDTTTIVESIYNTDPVQSIEKYTPISFKSTSTP